MYKIIIHRIKRNKIQLIIVTSVHIKVIKKQQRKCSDMASNLCCYVVLLRILSIADILFGQV